MQCKLTSVTLMRDNDSVLVLQGMRHVAPTEVYAKIQSEIDTKHRDGYVFLHEGVRKDTDTETEKKWNRDKKNTAKILRILMELYPFVAKLEGGSTQKDSITNPPGSINADIGFGELIHHIYITGFCINSLLIRKLTSKTQLEKQKEFMVKNREEKKDTSLLMKFIGWLFFKTFLRKPMSVIIDLRNRVAVDCIERQFINGDNKVYLSYGQAHLPGMLKMLKKNGWEVIERRILTFSV